MKNLEQNLFSDLCEIYLLNNNEIDGLIPLLIFPDNSLLEDTERMKVLNTHYIWRISLSDQRLLDYIELTYKDKVFYARKFITLSKREKQADNTAYDEFETIVIIIVLPEEISIFGKDLLLKLTSEIILRFEGRIYKVINSERTKREIIKSPRMQSSIKEGDEVRKELMNFLTNICMSYFASIIEQKKTETLDQQKALEVEIKAKNTTENEILNALVKITHLKDFLETELMKEMIDIWYPNEEVMIGFPVIPKVNDYVLTIEKESDIWLSKKINLHILQ